MISDRTILRKYKEGLSVENIVKVILRNNVIDNSVRRKDERIRMTDKEARQTVERVILEGRG